MFWLSYKQLFLGNGYGWQLETVEYWIRVIINMVDNTSIKYVFVNAIAPEEMIKTVCEGDIVLLVDKH